jgi:hypothetical protein
MLKAKHATFLLFSFSIWFPLSGNDETLLGLSRDGLLEALGKEQGSIGLYDKEILIYPRGKITLVDGIVTNVSFVSQEEYIQQTIESKKREAQFAEEKERLHREELDRANTLKNDKLSDPDFLKLPLEKQIVYWRQFKKDYPEVNIEPDFKNLIDRFKEEQDRNAAKQDDSLIAKKEDSDAYFASNKKSYFYYGSYTPAVRFTNYPYQYHSCSPASRYYRATPILQIGYKSNSLSVNYSSSSPLIFR